MAVAPLQGLASRCHIVHTQSPHLPGLALPDLVAILETHGIKTVLGIKTDKKISFYNNLPFTRTAALLSGI